ncbi:hypothetical protein ACVW00_003573 [Marmoricola sp. URHA0025 HA25]
MTLQKLSAGSGYEYLTRQGELSAQLETWMNWVRHRYPWP